MGESHYRILIGATLLITLYFDLDQVIAGIVGLMLFEGITNLRMPMIVNRAKKRHINTSNTASSSLFPFEAERILRFIAASVLILSYFAFPQSAWVLPWLLGFAFLGAGLTGVCPMIMLLRKTGFS